MIADAAGSGRQTKNTTKNIPAKGALKNPGVTEAGVTAQHEERKEIQ